MDDEQIRYCKAMGITPWQLNNNQNNHNPRLIIINEGEPLAPRASQLLNAMLESIGLDRKNVTLTTMPFLAKQIALIHPTLLLVLGKIPADFLLETKIPLIITYHPGYLLQNPSEKSKAFQDLQLAQRYL